MRERVLDGTRSPLDLTGASVRFRMSRWPGTSVAKVDAPAVITDPTWGKVEYRWSPGDTDEVATFLGEFVITDAEGKVRTHPNGRYLRIRVAEDLTSVDG